MSVGVTVEDRGSNGSSSENLDQLKNAKTDIRAVTLQLATDKSFIAALCAAIYLYRPLWPPLAAAARPSRRYPCRARLLDKATYSHDQALGSSRHCSPSKLEFLPSIFGLQV